MTNEEKVLDIMEQIFSYAKNKNNDEKVVVVGKLDERFECTGNNECRRCPDWWKARPQHSW